VYLVVSQSTCWDGIDKNR